MNAKGKFVVLAAAALLCAAGSTARAQDYWGYSTSDDERVRPPEDTAFAPDSVAGDSVASDDGDAYVPYGYFYPSAPRPWIWRARPRFYVSVGFGWGWDPWWDYYDPGYYAGYWGPAWIAPYYYPGSYWGWGWGGYWGGGYWGGWGRGGYCGGYGFGPSVPTGHRGFGSTRGAGNSGGNIVGVPGHAARQTSGSGIQSTRSSKGVAPTTSMNGRTSGATGVRSNTYAAPSTRGSAVTRSGAPRESVAPRRGTQARSYSPPLSRGGRSWSPGGSRGGGGGGSRGGGGGGGRSSGGGGGGRGGRR